MAKPEYSDVEEMSDEKFMALREVVLKDRDIGKYGGGFMKDVWRHTYEYRGVKYDIAMIRYLNSAGEIGMNQYGKWFVLEYPEDTAHIAELIKKSDKLADFLYKDTLHIWNDGQTLERMFYEMVDDAKRDIDWFLDDSGMIDDQNSTIKLLERGD